MHNSLCTSTAEGYVIRAPTIFLHMGQNLFNHVKVDTITLLKHTRRKCSHAVKLPTHLYHSEVWRKHFVSFTIQWCAKFLTYIVHSCIKCSYNSSWYQGCPRLFVQLLLGHLSPVVQLEDPHLWEKEWKYSGYNPSIRKPLFPLSSIRSLSSSPHSFSHASLHDIF